MTETIQFIIFRIIIHIELPQLEIDFPVFIPVLIHEIIKNKCQNEKNNFTYELENQRLTRYECEKILQNVVLNNIFQPR